MAYRKEASIFHYIGLLTGMGLLGAYFWGIMTVVPTNYMFQFILFMSGVLLVVSAFAFAYTKTRSGRTGLTILAGVLGGVHGYLDLVMFYGYGLIMFAWIAVGLLLVFATFIWLTEDS